MDGRATARARARARASERGKKHTHTQSAVKQCATMGRCVRFCTILISGTNRNELDVCLHCKLLIAAIQFKFDWKNHHGKVAREQYGVRCTLLNTGSGRSFVSNGHMHVEMNTCKMLMTNPTNALILTSPNPILKHFKALLTQLQLQPLG